MPSLRTMWAVVWAAVSLFAALSHGYVFWHISDVHLDLLFDPLAPVATGCRQPYPPANATAPTPFGKYGCDIPLSTLESALSYMASVAADVDFIVVSGDFAAHSLPSELDILTAINATTAAVQKFFPSVPVLPAIGNDDCSADYKESLVNHTWTVDLSKIWARWLPPSSLDTFLYAGYYAASPVPGVLIVVLNTVLYSPEFRPYYASSGPASSRVRAGINSAADLGDDIGGQIGWLQTQLQSASQKNLRVLVVAHIPPGGSPYDGSLLWQERYIPPVMRLVSQYKSIILGFFCGHLHQDDFRLLGTGSVLALLTPSLSLSNQNNPGVRLVSLDSQWRMSVETHFADISVSNSQFPKSMNWQMEYDHVSEYQIPFVGPETMLSLVEQMPMDSVLWSRFFSNRWVRYLQNRYLYYCSMSYVDDVQFDACMASGQDSG